MKKPILICLLAILALNACKKSSTSNSVNGTSIIGAWKFTSETVITYKNGSVSNTSTQNFNNSFLTLNSDNTGSSSDNGITTHFTYMLSGNNITFEIKDQSGVQNVTGIVKTLNSNKLEIYRDYSNTTGQSFDDIYSK